ncbi:MAG: hypothetical protein BRC25_02160 [Parcubacteria group bacterium SW_6_46_9]|nr:MAG: hypothetical protein BRC25_02160 [Parcubacteria group bacterium SW_6_46_9]
MQTELSFPDVYNKEEYLEAVEKFFSILSCNQQVTVWVLVRNNDAENMTDILIELESDRSIIDSKVSNFNKLERKINSLLSKSQNVEQVFFQILTNQHHNPA